MTPLDILLILGQVIVYPIIAAIVLFIIYAFYAVTM